MNPQQYPPQPGQDPQGYSPQGPPAPNGYGPQQPYPGAPTPSNPYAQQQPGQQPYPHNNQSMPQQPPMAAYNPYAYTEEYAQPPKKSPVKAVLVVVGILAILIVCGVVLVFSSGGNKSGNNNATTPTETKAETTDESGKDIVDRNDGTLTLSSKVNLSSSLKAQTLKANEKQQVNLSSGFSFMVNKVQDYTSPNPATVPAAGKKFVVATTVIGNRLNSGNLSVSYLDFRLRDTGNTLLPGHIATNEILSNQLSSPTEIKPGQQITGQIVFEVAANDTSWVFKHSETYQKTTDDTTFVVEGEIVVKLATAATATPSQSTTTPTTDTAQPQTTAN